LATTDLRFKEIEHKFVVGNGFDLLRFRDQLALLGPTRASSIHVRDRYYLTAGGAARRYLIRHRFDLELHHLTIKSLGSDAEVRDEVNLDLGQHAGDQAAQVDAFLGCLDVRWRGVIEKDVDVWHFPDCEVVHYLASTDTRSLRCVEFEATGGTSVKEALAVVERFERATGFDEAAREHLSLPQLLFPELSGFLGTSPS
jgi:hypothetical protein